MQFESFMIRLSRLDFKIFDRFNKGKVRLPRPEPYMHTPYGADPINISFSFNHDGDVLVLVNGKVNCLAKYCIGYNLIDPKE